MYGYLWISMDISGYLWISLWGELPDDGLVKLNRDWLTDLPTGTSLACPTQGRRPHCLALAGRRAGAGPGLSLRIYPKQIQTISKRYPYISKTDINWYPIRIQYISICLQLRSIHRKYISIHKEIYPNVWRS